jgi:hypothetical protein
LSHEAPNVLIGLLNPTLARALQEEGRKKGRTMNVHPAVTAVTVVLLALAFVGALTATGVLS